MPAPTSEAGLTICFSCLTPRTGDQLGECNTCRTRTCGLDNCSGVCLCSLLDERDTGE
jgi:hypothetical protein